MIHMNEDDNFYAWKSYQMNRKGQDILSECQTLEMEDINNFIP